MGGCHGRGSTIRDRIVADVVGQYPGSTHCQIDRGNRVGLEGVPRVERRSIGVGHDRATNVNQGGSTIRLQADPVTQITARHEWITWIVPEAVIDHIQAGDRIVGGADIQTIQLVSDEDVVVNSGGVEGDTK